MTKTDMYWGEISEFFFNLPGNYTGTIRAMNTTRPQVPLARNNGACG